MKPSLPSAIGAAAKARFSNPGASSGLLLGRVFTVSLETVRRVESLPTLASATP